MKYIKTEAIPVNGEENDCHYCCFALSCINPCRLPKGKHYEEV